MKYFVVFLIFCCCFEIVNSLVIYRRKPKPKLICKEESEWLAISQGNGKIENILTNGTIFELTNSDSHDSSSESREQVRLRPRPRRSINQTPIDASNTEPVIIIDDSNDNDFEIIGDLTKAEKKILQRKLAATCNALSLD
uniref:Uncharacterized protein n=1 Tax=Panagrolaimus sp. ES5 TaxID=591445 RepID=A0AC34GAC1_9BILA